MFRPSFATAIAMTALMALNPSQSFGQVSALSDAVRVNDHSEPALSFPEQETEAQGKLDALFAKTKKKPNILWLVIDDMGYGDPGCYGGGEVVGAATPNIDRLAREGLKLTSTYSQPTCTPTRSAMMLGRLPVRTGLTRPILVGDKVRVNPWDGELSVAQILSNAGYHTVLTGKWHTGELEGMRPFEVGFDEFQGYYTSQKELTQQVDARRYPDLVLDQDMAARIKKASGKTDMYYGRRGEEEKIVEKTTSIEQFAEADQVLAQFTIDQIRAAAQSGTPFFIAHNFMRMHADNHPSKEFRGKSAAKYQYKDNVVEVDALIGRIVAALDEAGIADNTFVFITSDNGPQLDAWPDGGYTPFRGAKASPWEGGVRVPGIAYWKGVIKAGRESNGLFDLMDLFSTSISLGGALDKVPTDRYVDAIDQTSFLLADNGKSKREKVFIFIESNLAAMRMYGYKIMTKVVQEQAQWLNIDMTTVSNVGLAPWLFNLYIDPKEQYPVGHRMNAWLASMSAELKAEAATFKKYPPKEIGLEQ